MSKTIDERIVSMKFDNKDFEKNASTSLSTIEKLKQALNFKGASKGLDEVKGSVNTFNMNPLLEAVNNINDRFSAMGIMGMTVLQNIANQAYQTGKQMLDSLTIEPIKEGFQEYELKMGSVQTIMAGIGADFEDPEALAMVTDKLQELNAYADKTIYSFSDMTSSIGKFTNAGVDLDRAVAAIQGISNEAAVSGANAEQASHAMYNFAQALSAGSVKLIDWKSIENANMATVEFKNELIQTAVAAGTLADNMDGTYTVLTENGAGGLMDDVISATQNFNDSLQYQWMTSDVLIDTLGRYANAEEGIGQKAFAAAQDVKTFTQLMDTLKEAVGSGWATTWEIIFGDFNEAKQLWSKVSEVVGGFIDQQSTARNELLQGWKDLGGRAVLLEGIASALKDIQAIIQPISNAFKMVFPKTTSQDLYNITVRFKELADRLMISGDDAESLRNIFLGLFSILQIIKNSIVAVINAFEPVGNAVIPVLQSVLKFLGDIGFYIFQNRENIQGIISTGIISFIQAVAYAISALIPALSELANGFSAFTKNNVLPGFETVGVKLLDYLKTLPEKISQLFIEMVNVIADCIRLIGATLMGFDDVETTSLDEFVNRMKVALHPLIVVFGAIGLIFSKLKDVIAFVYPYITQYLPVIGDAIGDIVKRIGKYISTMSASDIMDWINTGAYASFAMSFRTIAKSIGGAGEMFEAATGAFKQLGGVLKDYQKNLKADILLKIATAIAILAASLIALSYVEAEKLKTSVEAIGVMFGLLVASLKLITSSLGDDGILNAIGQIGIIKALGSFMIEFSVAIGIMTGCIIALSQIGGEDLKTALIGVAAIEALLGAIGIIITTMPKGKNSLVGLGLGLLMLASSVEKIAGAVVTLIPPLKELGTMDRETLIQGGIALAGMIVTLGAAMALTSKVKFGSAAGIMAMTYAISQMVNAVVLFSDMEPDKLKQGVFVLEGVLVGLALLAGVTGATKFDASSGAGILLLAVSLEVVIDVLKKLAELEHPWIGLGLMAIALTELAAAMIIMKGAKFGAAALLVMAVAIDALVPALRAFGDMEHPIKALLVLAGVFGVLAAATAVFTVLAPGMLLLAGALLALGVGILAFSAALALVAAIDIAAIIALLPALGIAIMEFCKMIEAVTPQVMSTIGVVIDEICKLVKDKAPIVLDAIFLVIETFFVQLAQHAPGMIESLFSIILTILHGVEDNIREITASVVNIVLQFIVGVLGAIVENIAVIIQKVFEIVTAIIEGIATALGDKENAEKLRTAIIDFCKALVEFVKNFFGIHSPSTVFQEIGWNLIEGLIAGIGDMIKAAGDKILELGAYLIETIAGKLQDFFNKGKDIVDNIGQGIDNLKDNVKNTFHNWVDSLKDFSLDGFIQSGKNILLGLKQGIEDSDTFRYLYDTTTRVFSAVRDRIAGIFQENSPSKVTFGFGRYVVEGFANGMKAYADLATNAADEFGEGTLDRMKNAVSNMIDLVENGIDSEPTIRPVFDMSEINSGIGYLDSMMSANRSIDLAASASYGMNQRIGNRNQNGVTVNNNDVIRAIGNLKDNITDMFGSNSDGLNVNNTDVIQAISELSENMYNMNAMLQNLQIVLDTGTLVGELSEPMDHAFGRMAVLNGRGVS